MTTKGRKTEIKPQEKHKGISRIDSQDGRTHGWYVRVFFKGEKRVKLFSDSVHGGREKALEKAIRFRNKAEKELGKPRTDRIVITATKRSKTTGIVGLRRRREKAATKSGELRYREMYEVWWCPEPNKVAKRSVSINKYGEEEAFRRAYMIRRKVERDIYGKAISPPYTQIGADQLALLMASTRPDSAEGSQEVEQNR
ncbi:MAG: AP2 domain-containing protein [Blastocatellia bacterium]|nr:AP2 domain-containing protein [Blastocatellia bacterium]